MVVRHTQRRPRKEHPTPGRSGAKGYLELIGTEDRIPVPDDPEGERKAVAAHPVFQRMVASAQRAQAEGRTRPIEQIFAELEAEEREAVEGYFAEHKPRRNRGTGTGESGRLLVRLPPALHKRLVDRAEARGISVNTLVIELLAAGASSPGP
jgi:predicted HicB family RNase H-like nuclease